MMMSELVWFGFTIRRSGVWRNLHMRLVLLLAVANLAFKNLRFGVDTW